MSIKAEITNHGSHVGTLEESDERDYHFTYDATNKGFPAPESVSVTLPSSALPYQADRLFGFFDGLIPEGWLLNITSHQWKIDKNDRMRLLLAVCGDCIGSVAVQSEVREPVEAVINDGAPLPPTQKLPPSTYCLCCLGKLTHDEAHYHKACAKSLFGSPHAPIINATAHDIDRLGLEVVNQRLAVTGVQRKLSLSLDRNSGDLGGRLTIVGLWGEYILKPAPAELPSMAANEHLIMNIASAMGIPVPPFGLIALQDGTFAYLVRRFDRVRQEHAAVAKVSVEDFGQIFDRNQGAQKYGSSYNQIGRWIKEHSSQPGLDVTRFFEHVLFSFLVGNSDLHLKNLSIFTQAGIRLTPCYDLVSVEALEPGDDEELALPLGGKKNKLGGSDFESFATYLGITPKAYKNLSKRYKNLPNIAAALAAHAWIPDTEKDRLERLIAQRASRLG